MLATAHIVFDRQYFETMYDDWLRHRSVWRRYVIYASLALLVFGIFLAAFFPKQWLVGAIFASLGLYETIDSATDRRRWVNERLSLARSEKTVDLTFDDTTIASASAIGTSSMLISGFAGFTTATKGFFLIPDTGISLYVPRTSVEPSDAYDLLVDSLRSAVTARSDSQTTIG